LNSGISPVALSLGTNVTNIAELSVNMVVTGQYYVTLRNVVLKPQPNYMLGYAL
jgi:hypothetical protein